MSRQISRSFFSSVIGTYSALALSNSWKSTAAVNGGFSWRLISSLPFSPQLRKSVGGKKQATAWTRLEARSTGSAAFGSPSLPVVPIMSDRCPPAEAP